MKLFKNLMFLQGHATFPRSDDSYGSVYGNRVANARALREKWLEAPREPGLECRPAPAHTPERTPCRA